MHKLNVCQTFNYIPLCAGGHRCLKHWSASNSMCWEKIERDTHQMQYSHMEIMHKREMEKGLTTKGRCKHISKNKQQSTNQKRINTKLLTTKERQSSRGNDVNRDMKEGKDLAFIKRLTNVEGWNSGPGRSQDLSVILESHCETLCTA